jgi:hypothetical protein
MGIAVVLPMGPAAVIVPPFTTVLELVPVGRYTIPTVPDDILLALAAKVSALLCAVAAAPLVSYTLAPMAVWMLAEVAAVIALDEENAAILGLTGEPLRVTVPTGTAPPSVILVPEVLPITAR